MRLRHRDGTVVHLAYGTNVLPAEDVDGLVAQATSMGVRIRRALDALPGAAAGETSSVSGSGSRRPPPTASPRTPTAYASSAAQLADHGVEVVTVNAFPYAAFQGPTVKHSVYLPTWTTRERLDYTLAAARVLAGLLPDDADHGSISSLPARLAQPVEP